MASRSTWVVVWLLVVNHLVGLIGLQWTPWSEQVAALTPVSLLVTAGLLIATACRDRRFWTVFAVVSVAGYLVELAGVHTGVIFGEYAYLDNLGPTLLGVPPMIGLNWWILIYSIHHVVRGLVPGAPAGVRIALGAALMVGIDLVIEPFAIEYGLWTWFGDAVPVRNYAAWFVVSAVLLAVVDRIVGRTEHSTARLVFGVLLVFFTANAVL